MRIPSTWQLRLSLPSTIFRLDVNHTTTIYTICEAVAKHLGVSVGTVALVVSGERILDDAGTTKQASLFKRQVLHTLGVVLTTAFSLRVVSEGTASEVQLPVAANARLTLRQTLALPDLSKYIVACSSVQAELDCVIVRSTDGVYLGLFRNSSQETDLGADLSITVHLILRNPPPVSKSAVMEPELSPTSAARHQLPRMLPQLPPGSRQLILKPLDKVMLKHVEDEHASQESRDKLIQEIGNVPLKRRDLATLKPGVWLNDEVFIQVKYT